MPFMLGVLLDHLKALRRTPVAPGELSRARNQLTSSVMMNLEMKSIVAEDIGRQVVVLDKRLDPQELEQRIQAVTPADLQRVASAALQAKPAVAVLGAAPGLMEYDEIVEALQDDGGTYSSMFNKFLGKNATR
jgi:predicted Zn-dependent peptidase